MRRRKEEAQGPVTPPQWQTAKRLSDVTPAHSFRTLLETLSTLARTIGLSILGDGLFQERLDEGVHARTAPVSRLGPGCQPIAAAGLAFITGLAGPPGGPRPRLRRRHSQRARYLSVPPHDQPSLPRVRAARGQRAVRGRRWPHW